MWSRNGSEVLAHYDPDYKMTLKKPDLALLAARPKGFSPLRTGPGRRGIGLSARRTLPDRRHVIHCAAEARHHLKNLLDAQIEHAKADERAVLIAFGKHFVDNEPEPDPYFEFSPRRGCTTFT